MFFNSAEYGLFLALVFAAFWILREARGSRLLLLLAASWFFYASWNWKYLSLILISTAIDYGVGRALYRKDASDPSQGRSRRGLLLLSLVANLGLLGVFKYYNFFCGNLEALFGIELGELEVLLPVGISFYTFQTLSYTIDIYRGKLAPAKNLKEFALFVAFFPQLVAGPIVRASDFLPQLEEKPKLRAEDFKDGLFRIAVGLGKKVVIADVLAVQLVDGVFAPGSDASGLYALLGVYGYALQIYGDFSGYSDIAIGSARLLGFRIPENFDMPYTATSIRDFWRRWHISLSSWLRDYLYIPLGGNRKGKIRTYSNLALTMLLGGLWHGAQWNFVFWGGLHGLWLAVDRFWERRGWPGLSDGGFGRRMLARILTFHLVCLAWVFFRAQDFAQASDVLGRIVSSEGSWMLPSLPMGVWSAFALGYLSHFLARSQKLRLQTLWRRSPGFLLGAFYALFFGLLAYVAVEGVAFIYFQF
ncbi:MAG: membrane-bound O-acyltransferase family protein [Planctomycetota bacterium]|nr:MAG: membrane-bound O-acyltransferase family protein [Planctomycetota bacterium]